MRRVGVTRITWTGGEPTLSGALPALLASCHRYGIRTVLTTHGVSIRSAALEALDPKWDCVRLSFDGLQETHNAIRGGRFFSKSIRTAEQMLARGFRTEANISVLGQNIAEIGGLIALLADVGITRFVLLTLMMRESAIDNAVLPPSPDQIDRLRVSLRELRDARPEIEIQMNDYGVTTDSYVVIESDAEILLCNEADTDRSFGSLLSIHGSAALEDALAQQTLHHRRIEP